MLLSLIIEMKISELFENYGAEAHTAMELAKELNQDINDLSEILASKSTISAGHPHNINSLRKNISELIRELRQLGYEYDPTSPGMIVKAPSRKF